MIGCQCGSQADAAHLQQAGRFKFPPSRPHLTQWTSPLQEAEPSKEAASGDEPVVASPEKKQRTSSPERSPEDGQDSHTDQKPTEPQQPQQEDQKAENDKDHTEPPQTNQKHDKPQQPQQEAPKTETNNNQAKPQQPQQEHSEAETNKNQAKPQPPQREVPKAKQQPQQQQQLKLQAGANASDAGKPANGMPAFPTPAEAAGAEVQQPVGEVTRLEDVTGVQQVRSLVENVALLFMLPMHKLPHWNHS